MVTSIAPMLDTGPHLSHPPVLMMVSVIAATPLMSTTVEPNVKIPARNWDLKRGRFCRRWLRSPKRAFSLNSSSSRRPRRDGKKSRWRNTGQKIFTDLLSAHGKVADMQENKKQLEEKVEALRTIKETAEQPEKEAKERHLKAWEEQKAAIRIEKDKAKMAEAFLELDDDADGFVSVSELQSHAELDSDADGTLTETEAQGLMGGADRVDTSAFENIWANIKDKYHSESQPVEAAPVETPPEEVGEPVVDNDSEPSPEEDISEEEDDKDDYREEDDKVPSTIKTPENNHEDEEAMPPYDADTQALIDAAQKARDDFNEAEKAFREVDDQIGNIEKELSFDFGPNVEFTYLYSQCYELSTGEYIYRLCPFNRVSQKPKYGGSETNLGTWGTWAGPENNKYLMMKYEHGAGCWQGPNRSTTVKLTCGKETVVTSTSEPSRCEYLMEFTTPAVCQEPTNVDLSPHDHEEL
ncbi:glucosidase 2 subunit beta-like isoform X2 [Myxocyprinus asiaticus]|uniref:glucosidase 2 subunit beta-like isoform X2 n=1 Tax=Myxocyprinus asiaticus TaxID=70543 RepID=UPI002223C159|nr:glucosidase 2 subunit beta-like isoform X2 [Myxocyprinus asiaticus]